MLDNETKRRIDTARDILVGKVPDPKSQVEQITIALIYKFMDDMDAEAEELGGDRTFFVGEYEKYSWAKLMATGRGGFEVLNLYAEAITKMTENEGIPALFRDIFKNAYLPYRDPETLKSFLKVINDFSYDHSERLGDAFEYLLSVLGSQGDAGQFRTPRHIIDFMVQVIDPQKHESILDPACGTAGFLISSYKHIMAANGKNGRPGAALTPDERTRLLNNIKGYDISPDMVRLSLVNLYLHGFSSPYIFEYDTLTSEDRWHEYVDIIMANPPFMSPKGGIKPHKRFSVQSKRSEVLFVDYIAEHLSPNGRAAVIVPEGIIFQSSNAYKKLRKMLVEQDYLVGVISLPAGVFNPYSGVKTSILWIDRALAKQTDQIAFVKIEHDGYGLGAQRRPIKQNDLPEALAAIIAFKASVVNGTNFDTEKHDFLTPVNKENVAENGDYNLSGERYKTEKLINSKFDLFNLGDICDLIGGGTPSRKNESFWTGGSIKWISSKSINDEGKVTGYELITQDAVDSSSARIAPKNSTIIITRVSVGKTAFADDEYAINQDLTALISKNVSKLNPKFLFSLSKRIGEIVEANAQGIGVRGVTRKFLSNIKFPLPPLPVQEEIVAELEGYQKIIDGARQVVENYRPRISINPDWPIVDLDTLCKIVRGSSPRPKSDPRYYGGNVPRLMVADVTRDGMYTTPQIDFLTEEGAKKSRPMKMGSVVITVSGNPGLPAILAVDACIHDGFAGLRKLDKSQIIPEYLYFILLENKESHGSQSVGAVFKNLTTDQLRAFKIPIPDLATQKQIVTKIEQEQSLVQANRQLITLFEQKIKERIGRVWGS
ncbi:MAG: N-6 DNA methylase [Anaerolineales bacterium]|nr:N-6 DNA methylase [Anaerolineales bacterium]